MANKKQIITFLFLLLSLFSFIKSIEIDPDNVNWITYCKDEPNLTEVISNSTAKEIRYAVEFNTTREGGKEYPGPQYLKIEISVDSNTPSPLLCFAHEDSYCTSRDILRKNPNYKNVYIWAKRNQYERQENEPFFTVKCAGHDVPYCAYNITVIGAEEKINVEPDFIYSYLASEDNKRMDYVIDKSKLAIDQRLVICLEGSTTAELKFSLEVDIIGSGNIKCVNIAQQEEDGQYFGKFYINKATKGEYLTLSVHAYTNTEENFGRANKDFNIINTGWLTSYIRSGTTSEECFPLTKEVLEKSGEFLYVTGRIHTKNAYFFLADEKGEWIVTENVEIMDGLLSYVFNNTNKTKELRYLCFEVPSDQGTSFTLDYMIFSFKVSDYDDKKMLDVYDYEEPMNPGEIYRHIIPVGRISTYHFGKSLKSSKKNDYTLNRLRGNSKVYIGVCDTFPDCPFEQIKITDDKKPTKLNDDIIYSTDINRNGALDYEKDVMVVHCQNALGKDFCEFDTSLFTENNEITLLQEKTFSKFVLVNETGTIKIDLQSHRIVSILVVDIMIYSGDMTFNIVESDIDYKQYYLSNKVVFVIYKQGIMNKVTIKYEPVRNSYFNIKYSFDNMNSEQIQDKFRSGQSYLVQISPSSQQKRKMVYLTSVLNNKLPFMVNFFEINCQFEVKRIFSPDKVINISDGYGQDYIKPEELVINLYDYEVIIKEVDPSNNNNKMCMIYVSGVEIDDGRYEREIVIPQNINQQLIFDDNPDRPFTRVRFTYPIVDRDKEFAIRFNVIDKANYYLNVYINGVLFDSIFNFGVSVTTMFYMRNIDLALYCKKDKPCSFNFDIEMREKIVQTNPMIEVTFREVLNIPTYIQKGNAKLDYVFGDKLYYLYTDIGRNDVGEITLNFLREFGSLWARIVRKDLKVAEKEANWRKYYRLPGPNWEFLKFDEYTRKLKITTKDTEECINGCYLLMTIQINDVGEYVPDSVFYLFSIIVKITSNKKTYNDIPKVVIQVDEYIIGSLDITEMDDRLISEFYEVWLPHDSDQVELDWQSSLASLYINVGGVRPTTTRADFPLRLEGTNGVLILNKDEILKKAKEKNIVSQDATSIQDINLVIGVWTNITDSGNQELYSLRVHQHDFESETEDSNDIDITIISSDQKHVCRPRKAKKGYDTIYRCLFVITFNADPSIINPLYVYGFPTNPLSDIHLLADFIPIDIFNEYDKGELKKLIPSAEKAQFNADKEGVNYIYIKELDENHVLFINLYTTVERNDLDLALINSVPVYNSYPEEKLLEIYPNPYTEQIFACEKEELKLKFPVQEGLAVTIEALSGEAEIMWEDDIDRFKLKGAGDRIKLFGNYINQLKIRNLNQVNKMDDPGFLFFVTFKTRDSDFNFDDIPYGKSTEISYRQTDLPVVLYSKLIDLEKRKYGLNVALTFKEINGQYSGQYIMSPIDITATLLDQNKIYTTKKKKDKTMKPTEDISIKGYYDPAIKTALLYLSKEKIDSFNIKDSQNPYLYLRIDKKPYYKEEIFDFFNVEADISGINDFIYPIEKTYHYGKLGADQEIIFYPLKLIRNKNLLRIQVALNSDQLDFSISEEPQSTKNVTFDFRGTREDGKVIIKMERPSGKDTLYLNFFRKENSKNKNDERLSNYVFKYINGESEYEFFDYKIMSRNITIKEEDDNTTINCIFNKIHVDSGDAEIIYFFKIVDNSTYIYGEEMNTIAVTESPSLIYYDKNPQELKEDADKLYITANKDYSSESAFNNYVYINVIAQIQQKNIIEYVAYNGIMNIRPPAPPSDSDSDDTDGKKESDKPAESTTNKAVVFGVVGGILGAIVIALIVVIVYFQMKNRNLLNQVKHVSFQKTNTNMDPNLLLQKQQEINPS